MWPLFCNEIALSYDQEERIRQFQKENNSNQDSWIHRHSCAASEHVLSSAHDSIVNLSQAIGNRQKSLMSVLSPTQKVKFLIWLKKKKMTDMQKLQKIISNRAKEQGGMQISPQRHDASNLYIINDRLSKVASSYPSSTSKALSPQILQKLTRRPAFEPLASSEEPKKGKMTKSGSSGALKRMSSEVDLQDGGGCMKKSTSGSALNTMPTIPPESAQNACSRHVLNVLGEVTDLIPKHRLKREVAKQVQVLQPSTTMYQQPMNVHFVAQAHQEPVADVIVSQFEPNPIVSSVIPVAHTQQQTTVQQSYTIPIPEPVPISSMKGISPLSQAPIEPEPVTSSFLPRNVTSQQTPNAMTSVISAPVLGALHPANQQGSSEFDLDNFVQMDDLDFLVESSNKLESDLFDDVDDWDIGEGLVFY